MIFETSDEFYVKFYDMYGNVIYTKRIDGISRSANAKKIEFNCVLPIDCIKDNGSVMVEYVYGGDWRIVLYDVTIEAKAK